jgi:acetoin utilization deacetylase AcuC-like enzyme
LLTFFNEHHAQHAPHAAFPPGAPLPYPDFPERADIVVAALHARGLDQIVTPHGVSLASLERVHTARYLHFLRSAWSAWLQRDPRNAGREILPGVWPGRTLRYDLEPEDFIGRLGLHALDGATPLTAGAWIAAKSGADCAINAAHALRLGQHGSFALTRPPGHQAGADHFGGGCLLNNAALAAQHLLDDGLERVAILDIDACHGSGTQGIFYQRSDVLVVSIHADPRTAYPYYAGHADETGNGAGLGFNMNLPLARSDGAGGWFAALETACLKMAGFNAQALVVSLGVDGERLAGADFTRIGERLAYLGLPTAFVLEGGAAGPALGINVANVLEGFETAA